MSGTAGVVVIGRNEGERLFRCLDSVRGCGARVVYVDSGSTDGSVEAARGRGVEVVELDMHVPFTAARARNAGLERLQEIEPVAEFVQFVDGDCELAAGWLEAARRLLQERADVAAVCGRLRERHPESSRYNRLCDMEWNTSVGEVESCGGIAMMRTQAVRKVGGFRAGMIAGEEPELCARLRGAGWRIVRLDAQMALHDAAMMRFGQWWRRAVRAGHAFAEGAWLHGRSAMRHNVRRVMSILVWAMVLPVAGLALAWPTSGVSLGALLLGYTALWVRVRRSRRRGGDRGADASLYATFCVLGKFAELVGVVKFVLTRVCGRSSRLIEYKSPAAPAAGASIP